MFGAIHGTRLFWLVPALLYAGLGLLASRAVTGLVPDGPLGVQVPGLVFGAGTSSPSPVTRPSRRTARRSPATSTAHPTGSTSPRPGGWGSRPTCRPRPSNAEGSPPLVITKDDAGLIGS
ncbi:MAG TPA: hypothetical protein VFQ77_09520 [Pseudonocardiaceae bacterium]|nr:hypothetical protein [Pseudonocardiaceae bacterium]